MIYLKNNSINVFLYIILSLILLFATPGFSEKLPGNKNLVDQNDIITIPNGVYTLDLKSLYVKESNKGYGGLIFKSYFALNIKSSWSGISDKITFIQVPLTDVFRKFKNWTPSICVIKSDGNSFKKLTDGSFGDFNPTWVRYKEEIIFSRLDHSTNHWAIFLTTPEFFPGREILISDPNYNEAGVTTTNDGRILIQSDRSGNNGFYLLDVARNSNDKASGQLGKYQKLVVEMPKTTKIKRLVRESISPDSSKLVFEFTEDPFNMDKSVIFLADLNIHSRPPKISNAYPIVPIKKKYSTIYPKWTEQGEAIIYVSNQTGNYQIYRYLISNGKTDRLSPNDDSDYTYFSSKNTPN